MKSFLYNTFFSDKFSANNLGKYLLLIGLITLTNAVSSHSQTFNIAECSCLQNGTSIENSQFEETITIISENTGENWKIIHSTGFFDINSPDPPASPIPYTMPVTIPEIVFGIYTIKGIRENNTNWSLTISDGTSQHTISSSNTCRNPKPYIIGDPTTCIDKTETYHLDIPAEVLNQATWTLSGGGAIVSGQGSNTIEIQWGDTPGTYNLSLSGNAGAFPGQSANTCNLQDAISIDILTEGPIAMACKGSLNKSFDENCVAEITPSLLLEDMEYTDASYDIKITDLAADTLIEGNIITALYKDKLLRVDVIHDCSENECWSQVIIQDQIIPELNCEDDITISCNDSVEPEVMGFPVDETVVIISKGNNAYTLQGFDQCGEAELTYSDEYIPMACSSDFGTRIKRTWTVTDESGNADTCYHNMYVNRVTLDDLIFPPHWDDITGDNPSLESCGGWEALPYGNPSPDYTGYPSGAFCLDVTMDFEDFKQEICGQYAYEIIRRWEVIDNCTDESRTHLQTITVVDSESPVCIPPAPFSSNTRSFNCSPEMSIPHPTVEDCSSWDYTIAYKVKDNSGDPFTGLSFSGIVQNNDGTYSINDINGEAAEALWIVYFVTDACGNTGRCVTEMSIIDEIEPAPICNQEASISLNQQGFAYITPGAFDSGSWDNCEIDRMEIRRTTAGCGQSDEWADNILFCCEDAGNTVWVELRVWDISGNYNDCSALAKIEDNLPPFLHGCPEDVTLNCDADMTDFSQYGFPTVSDNCEPVTITESIDYNLSDCGLGTIIRNFEAIDFEGNIARCFQTIYIENSDPFYINRFHPNDQDDDIIWPEDYTIPNGCMTGGIAPNELPEENGYPTILPHPCSDISVSYEDIIFDIVEDACFNILREWQVIDYCQYDPFFPGTGTWTYSQQIKVRNDIAPTIENGCDVEAVKFSGLPDCYFQIDVEAQGSDDCTPSEMLNWSYSIDFNSDGSIDESGNGKKISTLVEEGTHLLTWIVEDECSNVTSCSVEFVAEDKDAPIVNCLGKMPTVVIEPSGSATIWAKDFDSGSYDECSNAPLSFSFSSDISETSRTFFCENMNGAIDTFNINLHVTDEHGNRDFCTASFILRDNNNICNSEVETGLTVSGSIFTEDGKMVNDVEVMIRANMPGFPILSLTENEGKYAFNDLPLYTEYSLEPERLDNPKAGVSTLDLLLIQRHILGLSPLRTPYKIIAADIDGSQRISGADIVQLRKLIIGVIDELPDNNSWRFVDAAYVFPDPLKPFPFNENIGMTLSSNDYGLADFIGIKVGDVNNSFNPNNFDLSESNNRSIATLNTKMNAIGQEGILNLPVSSDIERDIAGFQFTLAFDPAKLEFEEIESGILDIKETNIGFNYLDKGLVAISWNGINSINASAETTLFTLKFRPKTTDISSYDIRFNDDLITSELYTENSGNIISDRLSLVYNSSDETSNDTFHLFQNVPNPFNNKTTIGFILPEKGMATFKITDLTGRIILTTSELYDKGYNKIELDINALNSTGVLYYQLETDKHMAGKKMVVIK